MVLIPFSFRYHYEHCQESQVPTDILFEDIRIIKRGWKMTMRMLCCSNQFFKSRIAAAFVNPLWSRKSLMLKKDDEEWRIGKGWMEMNGRQRSSQDGMMAMMTLCCIKENFTSRSHASRCCWILPWYSSRRSSRTMENTGISSKSLLVAGWQDLLDVHNSCDLCQRTKTFPAKPKANSCQMKFWSTLEDHFHRPNHPTSESKDMTQF